MWGEFWVTVILAGKYDWPFKDIKQWWIVWVVSAKSYHYGKKDTLILVAYPSWYAPSWKVDESWTFTIDRIKVPASRKCSLSWPTSLDNQKGKVYFKEIVVYCPELSWNSILSIKLKETPLEVLPSSCLPWCLTFLRPESSSNHNEKTQTKFSFREGRFPFH